MTEKYDIAHRIEHLPTYGLLVLTLKPEQKVLAETSAMVAMDKGITLKSAMKGGWVKGVQRILGKESLFLNEFSTGKYKADLYLAPTISGSIQHYYLKENRGLMIQSSSFLACSEGVEIDSEFQGIKGFFSGESLFLLKAIGRGDLWFNAYGGIIEVSVSGDHIVDTGYIVAFEESLSYRVENIRGLSLKGLASGFFGGEGLVCRFSGKGKLWLQCRQLSSLINFVKPFC